MSNVPQYGEGLLLVCILTADGKGAGAVVRLLGLEFLMLLEVSEFLLLVTILAPVSQVQPVGSLSSCTTVTVCTQSLFDHYSTYNTRVTTVRASQ